MGKRVFISYAWTSDEYQKKVLELATRLRNDGVDIILDKWDLHTGADRFLFMEKSVIESDKVLILCNKVYKDKADNRIGGAGQETIIIAPEIYERNEPEKFIPIVMERNFFGKEYTPRYLKSLIYIDFTDKDKEKQYVNLMCAIHGVTIERKPKTGKIPDYIEERVLKDENEEKKTNFSKRLSIIVQMINKSSSRANQINLEIIGSIMGLESVNELNKYYYGTDEPTYEFIDKLCKTFGINEQWMKYGKESPYKNNLKYAYNPEEILEEISCVKEVIFFTVMERYRRELGIIVKNDTYFYQCYPRAFTFHSDVGCGGAAELHSLFNMLKQLNEKRKMPSGVYSVTEEEFNMLLSGDIYPGMVCKLNKKYLTYMLDDFIDLYRDEETKKKYFDWYGQTFVDSQNLIKERLKY